MIEFFKKLMARLFGGGVPALPAPQARTSSPGPLGLRLGKAVSMNLDVLRLDEENLSIKGITPREMFITGHGVAKLDGGGLLHRFYDDEGRILQFVCMDSVENPTEVMILLPWDSVTPQTEREWNNWEGPGGKMRAARYDAEGTVFDRYWGDPSSPDIPLVEFTETIDADEGPRKFVHQKTMAFRRSLPNGNSESLLIISEQDQASADRGLIGFMLGYGLSSNDVRPF